MKRGCLIVLVLFPVLIICVAAYGYHRASQTFGLAPAERIDAETLATPETRVRAVVDFDKVSPFLHSFIPAGGLPLPWYASYFVKDPVAELLPYQMAVLGGADYRDNDYKLTLFVNEKILGPAAVTVARARLTELSQQFQTDKKSPSAQLFNSIKWQEGFVDNSQRGSLLMRAGLPLPAGMQNRVLKTWEIDKGPSKELNAGGNFVEITIDNAGGDLLTLAGTLGKANGLSLDQMFATPDAERLVKAVDNIHATANIEGEDTLDVVVKTKLTSDDFLTRMTFLALSTTLIEGSSMLETTMSMGQRTVTPAQAQFKGLKLLLTQYGMTADYKDGEKPVFDGNTLVATYEISGFRPLIQQQVDIALQQLAALK